MLMSVENCSKFVEGEILQTLLVRAIRSCFVEINVLLFSIELFPDLVPN